MNDNLPKISPLLSSAAFTSGYQPPEEPKVNVGPTIKAIERLPKDEQKIQAIRLAAAMEKLHFTAHDRGAPEADGVGAAQALAMTCLKHFDTIIWALRVAGGARKP